MRCVQPGGQGGAYSQGAGRCVQPGGREVRTAKGREVRTARGAGRCVQPGGSQRGAYSQGGASEMCTTRDTPAALS